MIQPMLNVYDQMLDALAGAVQVELLKRGLPTTKANAPDPSEFFVVPLRIVLTTVDEVEPVEGAMPPQLQQAELTLTYYYLRMNPADIAVVFANQLNYERGRAGLGPIPVPAPAAVPATT